MVKPRPRLWKPAPAGGWVSTDGLTDPHPPDEELRATARACMNQAKRPGVMALLDAVRVELLSRIVSFGPLPVVVAPAAVPEFPMTVVERALDYVGLAKAAVAKAVVPRELVKAPLLDFVAPEIDTAAPQPGTARIDRDVWGNPHAVGGSVKQRASLAARMAMHWWGRD